MSVSEKIRELEGRVRAACQRAGRARSEITLVAVSKFQEDALVEEAYGCGLRDFGENYVQALQRRRRERMLGARWHLIGPLQTNKARGAVACADVFQALDSERVLAAACKALPEAPRAPWPVYVEVNIDEEPGKAGALPAETPLLLQKVLQRRSQVLLRGLMCVPKAAADLETARKSFQKMRRLRDELDPALELSMGMSADFEVAIEEGADVIRVGTLIFGQRLRKL